MTHYCGWLRSWCGTVIISKAKKWPTTAISSTETEIISMSECARDVRPTRWILTELGFPQKGPTVLWADNTSAIVNAEEEKRTTDRTKHIRIRDFFIRECVSIGEIMPLKANTHHLSADMLTKALARVKYERFQGILQGTAPRAVDQKDT